MKVQLKARGDYEEWRDAAREALKSGIHPRQMVWRDTSEGPDLFDLPQFGEGALSDDKRKDESASGSPPVQAKREAAVINSDFIELTQLALCHSDPGRFDLCYRLLWRLQSHRQLLKDPADQDVRRLHLLVKSVRRDMHKMKAFVRFKEVEGVGNRRSFVAWFEPEHFIIAQTAPFFRRRFGDMDWIIASPKGSAAWDGQTLKFSDDAAQASDLKDETDDLWRTYYANIFNPARLKINAMRSEMPKKYWKNLPEAELIPELIRDADRRVQEMREKEASDATPKFHKALKARAGDV